MRWIVGGGVAVFELSPGDTSAMLGLLERYRDRPMDLADASLVILAGRLGISDILTVDRADFDIYRLTDGGKFTQVLTGG